MIHKQTAAREGAAKTEYEGIRPPSVFKNIRIPGYRILGWYECSKKNDFDVIFEPENGKGHCLWFTGEFSPEFPIFASGSHFGFMSRAEAFDCLLIDDPKYEGVNYLRTPKGFIRVEGRGLK
jgi:hypothetical protein